ncbi:MAG: hypothetical protein V1868_02260 [Patescibacteria group bacterium]
MKILFVHGFSEKPFAADKSITQMKEYLRKEGFEVDVIDYSEGEPTYANLGLYSKRVAEEIRKEPYFAIIAHSMGGPITNSAIQMTSTKTRIVIFLESPNLGVPLWLIPIARILGIHLKTNLPSVKDLMTGSYFLQKIELNRKISYHQIGGLYSALFPKVFIDSHIPTLLFPTTTHSGLKRNPKVLRQIAKILKN